MVHVLHHTLAMTLHSASFNKRHRAALEILKAVGWLRIEAAGGYGGALSSCVSVKGVRKFVLDLSSDSKNHGRLLIASTDGIGQNAQQVIDRQEK